MSVLDITNSNYVNEVTNSDKPVLLDFWARWCGACKMFSPTFDRLSEKISDIKFGRVNVDDEPELARQFGVMSIPTIVYVKGGKTVNRSVGAIPESAVLRMIGK